ncbi:MAG: signal peptidase I [Alphaproteobacteria bacterium]
MTNTNPEETAVTDTTQTPDTAAAKPKQKDEAIELLKAMVVAAVIALFIRCFLFEPFNIPSGSMLPTLLVGDYLFVEKYSYGYSKYSFPLDAAPIKGRMAESMPKRGDVAVFRKPSNTDIDYIKRIIGLPGDTIQMKEGRLYINGKIVPRDLVGTSPGMAEDSSFMVTEYTETLPNGVKHKIFEKSDDAQLDDTEEFTVPEGHYFAMGDNRDSSLDSRTQEVRYVPAENLIGRASFLFFSTEGVGDKCERDGMFGAIRSVGCRLVEWPAAVRYGRIFSRVSKL